MSPEAYGWGLQGRSKPWANWPTLFTFDLSGGKLVYSILEGTGSRRSDRAGGASALTERARGLLASSLLAIAQLFMSFHVMGFPSGFSACRTKTSVWNTNNPLSPHVQGEQCPRPVDFWLYPTWP